MSQGTYKFVVVFALGMILVVYTNCGAPFGKPTALKFGNGVQVVGSTESIGSFATTVYPITRSRCQGCHTTQPPTTAHENPQVAHNAIIGGFKVDFDNPSASRLVRKLRDENHNCWGNCKENADEMQAAIEKWALAFKQEKSQEPEAETESGNGLVTDQSRSFAAELQDPKNTVGNVTSISWDISAFVGFEASFLLDISEYDEYSYKFSNPRISTGDEKVFVKNVKILINGKYDPQNALYTVIDKTTTPEDRLLSGSALVAFKDKGADLDRISVSFEKLRLVTEQNQSLVAFEETVYAVTRANCSSCHSVTAPARHASPDPSTAHDVVLTRSLVNFNTVTSSPLYRFLKEDRHNCGNTLECDDLALQMQQAIEEWKSRRD